VLSKLSNIVKEAQQRALDCADQALTVSAEARAEWIKMERGWAHLAETYLLADSLQRYLLDFYRIGPDESPPDRLKQKDTPSSASINVPVPSLGDASDKWHSLARECQRKAELERNEVVKRRWLELARGWELMATKR